MKMIKTLLVILGIIIHSANHLYADIPHFIDFKFILNESDAGKKAQTALKNKLNKGIKSSKKLRKKLNLFFEARNEVT